MKNKSNVCQRGDIRTYAVYIYVSVTCKNIKGADKI